MNYNNGILPKYPFKWGEFHAWKKTTTSKAAFPPNLHGRLTNYYQKRIRSCGQLHGAFDTGLK